MTTAQVRERTEQTTNGRWFLKTAQGMERFESFDAALEAVGALAKSGATGEWKIFIDTADGFFGYREGRFSPQKETTLSAPSKDSAQGQSSIDATVYNSARMGVKANGQAIVVVRVKDVAAALAEFRRFKGRNVTLLLKYTDGSNVVTEVNCRTQSVGKSWVETAHPRHDPQRYFEVLREYGAGH